MADTDDRPGPFWGIQELQRAEVWARNAQIPEGIRETILGALRSESIQRQVERDLVQSARWPQEPATLYRNQVPAQHAANEHDPLRPNRQISQSEYDQILELRDLRREQLEEDAIRYRQRGGYAEGQVLAGPALERHQEREAEFEKRQIRELTSAPGDMLSQSRDIWAKIGARVSTLGPSQDPMATTYGAAPPRERKDDDLRIPDWPKAVEPGQDEKFSQRIRKAFGL